MTGRAERLAPALSTGAFRIAASAVAVFLLVAAVLAVLLIRDAGDAVSEDVMASIEAETQRIAQSYASGGRDGVRLAVEQYAASPGHGLYLLTTRDGGKLAGNLATRPQDLVAGKRGGVFSFKPQGSGDAAGAVRQGVALRVALGDDLVAYIGRDIETQRQRLGRMRLVLLVALAALVLAGLAGGYAVSRHVLRRVEEVNATARSIMGGDMSRRIVVTGGDDEIDRLALNLNRMLDRIEMLMQGLREVSDNIAHDLKTPLNRLRNRAEAALRDPAGEGACRDGLERTIEEADDLIKTFNALLLIARLEAGALEGTTEDVDVATIVGDVAELYQPVAEEAGLSFDVVYGPVSADVNPHLISQAVANLIDNAIKYSSAARTGPGPGPGDGEGGPSETGGVRVEVERAGNGIVVTVADSGPGIAAEDRERALKRFVRLERSRSRPGTGLGLSLVAAVARLHGGSLRLEDNAPGLRVVFTLPGASPHAKTPRLQH